MTIEWYDYVGTSGVILILLAYFLLQTNRLSSANERTSVPNLIGAVFIAISLLFHFNLPAFIIEMFWIAISVYGITRYVDEKRNAGGHSPG